MSLGTKNRRANNENTFGVGCVGTIALGALVHAKAQYYTPRPPDYGYAYPTVTDGLGMTARPVGRCRVETARPTEVRLVEDGAPGTAARSVTQFMAALVRHTEVPSEWLGPS